MKKFQVTLLALIGLVIGSACNEKEGDYPYMHALITTVRTLDSDDRLSDDYYFERDNGETLFPSERPTGFKPQNLQRALIYFDLLPQSVEGYTYNIRLYEATMLFTGTSKVVTTREELEALGGDRTGFRQESFNLTHKWLTFHAIYPVTDNSKHTFALAVDRTSEQPGGRRGDTPQDNGYLPVTLCHSAGGDVAGYRQGHYISFDLEPIAEELKEKKGIELRIDTFENGTKYVKLDLPQNK